MLTRLLQVGALARAVEHNFTLLPAALRTDAPVNRRTKSLLFTLFAEAAAQTNLLIHYAMPLCGGRRRAKARFLPGQTRAFTAGCARSGNFGSYSWFLARKTRIKCGDFAVFPQAASIKITAQSAGKLISKRGGFMAAGMTKTQLVRHLAEKVGANNRTAAAFLENLADTAIKETKKNGIFVVPGIGRLVKAHRKARVGRNPQTGEPIQIKAKTVVKFRVAKAAKDAIAPKK